MRSASGHLASAAPSKPVWLTVATSNDGFSRSDPIDVSVHLRESMTESHAAAPGDKRLVRYLLGLLPDAETERLDEASIVDDDVAARLRVVEDDLVDAYVVGTLDQTTLEIFEWYYLASPRRRQRVAAAQRLLHAVGQEPEPLSS